MRWAGVRCTTGSTRAVNATWYIEMHRIRAREEHSNGCELPRKCSVVSLWYNNLHKCTGLKQRGDSHHSPGGDAKRSSSSSTWSTGADAAVAAAVAAGPQFRAGPRSRAGPQSRDAIVAPVTELGEPDKWRCNQAGPFGNVRCPA